MDLDRIRQGCFPLGALLAATGTVLARRFWAVLAIVLIVYVPCEALLAWVAPERDTWLDVKRSLQIESALAVLIGVLATLAIYRLVEGEVTGARVSAWRAIAHALRRWRSAVATAVFVSLVLIVGFVLLVVPGVIFAGNYVFAICAVSLRDCSLREALRYSKSLVKGRWWSVVGVLLILALVAFALAWIASLTLESAGGHWLTGVAAGLVTDVIMSFLTVATGVYFLALERKEPEAQPEAHMAGETAGTR
jgi:hypothetical protein